MKVQDYTKKKKEISRIDGEALKALKDFDIIIKASRLAESILMDWNKDEQVELAKDVAVITHNILVGEKR